MMRCLAVLSLISALSCSKVDVTTPSVKVKIDADGVNVDAPNANVKVGREGVKVETDKDK
ncbi:MAG TPA: hypothetical protein PKA06_13335 [Gemmatales bacterium]|nr:hypothetical protein [Gemmatales bacterium]HMP15533.1 hypothetical protein [Gemmatales bacterium]